jgi:uncharacterized protein (TIGR02147 family)
MCVRDERNAPHLPQADPSRVIIADWYHYAILELTYLDSFPTDSTNVPAWIASQLGIGISEARLAVERLLELELLTRDEAGRYRKTDARIATADKKLTTAAHRKRQQEILEKAIASLQNDPIEDRNHSTMTMAIDQSKLCEAKELIREFQSKLCSLLESGKRERVYELAISLFPLQKNSKTQGGTR